MAVQYAPTLGATGWVVVTNRRHSNPTGVLPGCPEHEAVFNHPTMIAAEYLAASVAAAREIYQGRLEPMGLLKIRLKRRPQLIEAILPTGGPYFDGMYYTPVPLVPTFASQQWGQQWADQGHQGVATTLPVAPPPGGHNLWTCVYLQPGTVVRVKSSVPWNEK
jgi:hypothetical protein